MKKRVRFNLEEGGLQAPAAAPANRTSPGTRKTRQLNASFADWCKVNSHIVRCFTKDEYRQWWQFYTTDCQRAVFLIGKMLDKHNVEIRNTSESEEFHRIALRWRVSRWISKNRDHLTTLSAVVTQAFFQDKDYDWLVGIVANADYNEQQRAEQLCHLDNRERLARLASKLEELEQKIHTLPAQYEQYMPALINYVAANNDFLMMIRRNEFSDRIADYVIANLACYDYLRQLHRQLTRFSHDDYSVHQVITDARFDTDELTYLLVAGLKSWRLEMLTRICSYDRDDVVRALTFQESHRGAISDYLQVEQAETHWQAVPQQAKQQAYQYFVSLNQLLQSRNVVDVSRLWYAAGDRIRSYGSVFTPLATLNLFSIGPREQQLYVGSFASGKKCYDDAMKNDEDTFLDNGMLTVDQDVLLWLFLRHRDNAAVVNYINANAPVIQPVFADYAQPIVALNDAMDAVLEEAEVLPQPSPAKRIKTERVAEDEPEELEYSVGLSLKN